MLYSLNKMLAMSVALILLPACAVAGGADVFDKPLDKQIVKLLADPDTPQAKPKRSCFYYPGFMVKEVDLGEVGADELAIAPIAKGGQKLSCDAKTAHEIVIKSDDWSGYFEGVKGDFVFFTSGDGVNGGMPFAVFNKDGKKLFEETAGTELFRSIALSDGGIAMRYRRVFKAPCSLYADAKGCWKKIMAVTSLPEAARPDCAAAYEKEIKRTPKFAKDIPTLPTIIGYNVEARYAGGKLTFAPLAGPATCWLED